MNAEHLVWVLKDDGLFFLTFSQYMGTLFFGVSFVSIIFLSSSSLKIIFKACVFSPFATIQRIEG